MHRIYWIFILGLLACENSEQELTDWTRNIQLREEASNVESYLSQGGTLRAKLLAPKMVRLSADTVYAEFPNTLHCDFYNNARGLESRLDSKYGIYYENLNRVFLRDSVVVITTKGDTLLTQQLWWDQNTQLFTTETPVTFKAADKRIYAAKGLEATQDLSRVTFRETVGRMRVNEGGMPF
ncbi:MAG: LPS export ABC transporter periplasmic protein LptC [Bacteroidetes bacterium]|nr:LPS export ABC transporter periplasmic protein LptC [Bacteroidota bacterium]